MESKGIRNMRLKQVTMTNGLVLTAIIIFFIIINAFTVKSAHFFLVLGGLVFIQGVFGLLRGDSTKSFIPIFEKVAIYEKQKMGSEWYKQRKVNYIWNLVLSCFLFLQSYWYRDSPDDVFQMDLPFLFIMTFILFVMVNISLIIHFRKVDRSTSELDMKGYTWKSNLVGVVVGIVFAWVIFMVILFYMISGI